MTHKQLQQMIIRHKGDQSWRAYGESLGVAFQDLCAAAKSDRVPKSGVLRALGVRTVTQTRYEIGTTK